MTSATKSKKKKVVLKGIAASPGKALGRVKIVKSLRKMSRFVPDEIIVANFFNPDFIILLKKLHPNPAIISDRGGATSLF